MRTSVLLDVIVVLDVLLERAPHVEAAAALWALVERDAVRGLVPAHGVTTVHYIARRQKGDAFARQVVAGLLAVFDVAAADTGVLTRALGRGWPDFEDAVVAESAVAAGCDLIVTRNPTDFPLPPLPVLEPWEALSVVWPRS